MEGGPGLHEWHNRPGKLWPASAVGLLVLTQPWHLGAGEGVVCRGKRRGSWEGVSGGESR